MRSFDSIKEKIVKEVIQNLIENFLGKDYVLVHRKGYTDLLEHKVKEHKCSCGKRKA